MGQVVVRNLNEEVKMRLKRRAQRHGRSMEDEIRMILSDAVKGEDRPVLRLGSQIAARFAGEGIDGELPELHGQTIQPIDFDR